MDEIQHHAMEEQVAYGGYLLETLSDIYACEPTEADISASVFDHSECGAWFAFEDGVPKVGTIVEGSDATYSEAFELSDDPEELKANFLAAIKRCEAFADEAWAAKGEG